MGQLRQVSKLEKIVFPIAVTVIVSLIVPDSASLVGMLMLGNLMKESGVCDRLVKTATNELMNIITIFLGVTVGATAVAQNFLKVDTLLIIALGLIAFCIGTACGVLLGKLMYLLSGGKINPLIGSAGVSARSYGSACFPEGRSGDQPLQLPSHACHGSERCRRYRFRSCGGRSAERSWLIRIIKAVWFSGRLFLCGKYMLDICKKDIEKGRKKWYNRPNKEQER